jgi:hypothetical protein
VKQGPLPCQLSPSPRNTWLFGPGAASPRCRQN